MTEPTSKDSVSGELKRLGENLKSALNALWESDERKSATRQLEQSAAEVSKAIDKFAEDVTNSETTKRLQNEMGDLQQRIKSGELESKVRADILATLNRVNQELNQFSQRWSDAGNPTNATTADPEPDTSDPDEGG